MEHEMKGIYRGVVLCPMTHKDIHKYRVLRNENREYFFNTNKITSEQQEIWYKEYLKLEGEYMFSIYDEKNNYMGGCGLYNINGHRAEFGRIVIDRHMRGGKSDCCGP